MEKDQEEKMNDVEVLMRRALVVEDFDEAVEALHALKTIDKTCASTAAARILNEGIGDVFYQAAAFRELYEVSVVDAVNYVEEKADTTDSYILGTMLTSVAVDKGFLENERYVKKAVAALRHALDVRCIEDLQKIQAEKKFFEETYVIE